MPSGGDIKEITWNHPTLGSGRFLPKSGASSTYDKGGYRSDDSDDGIDAGGNMIDTMSLKRWSFEVDNIAWDMLNANRQELESMTDLAGDLALADWTFTNINGIVYMGNGKPTGDIKGAGKDSTMSFKVSGGGIMQIIG